jgi:RimJ/RimL family protein N-acetyltransferase
MVRLEPFGPDDFDRFISWIGNKELLLQIAGTYFSYPLTSAQLQNYLNDDNSRAFNIVDTLTNTVIGHAEIIPGHNKVCKLDKVLIGDKANRGKGIGRYVINLLLAFSFKNLEAKKVELNVYDWNTVAIRSYERCGLIINYDKQMTTEFDGAIWAALNMVIDKEKWASLQDVN